jgi:proteasome lid subunit RPN8/RPN11
MKRRVLSSVEIRTLRDMGIFHSHPRTRMRASDCPVEPGINAAAGSQRVRRPFEQR